LHIILQPIVVFVKNYFSACGIVNENIDHRANEKVDHPRAKELVI